MADGDGRREDSCPPSPTSTTMWRQRSSSPGGSLHVGYWVGQRRPDAFLEAINLVRRDYLRQAFDLRPDSNCWASAEGWGARDPDEATDRRRDHRHRDHVREVTKRMNAAELRNRLRSSTGNAAALAYPDGGRVPYPRRPDGLPMSEILPGDLNPPGVEA
jgi:hypothetical protein